MKQISAATLDWIPLERPLSWSFLPVVLKAMFQEVNQAPIEHGAHRTLLHSILSASVDYRNYQGRKLFLCIYLIQMPRTQ